MLTVSPPVSPSVVARILMIQKARVIAGTLLRAAERSSVDGIRKLLTGQRRQGNFLERRSLAIMRERARMRALRMEGVMRVKLVTICAAGLLVGGCFKEKPRDHSAESARQISQIFNGWAKAFEAKDVDGVMAMYAPGTALTAYDIVPPLQFKGADAYRKDYSEFFSQFSGPLQVETPDM